MKNAKDAKKDNSFMSRLSRTIFGIGVNVLNVTTSHQLHFGAQTRFKSKEAEVRYFTSIYLPPRKNS